jgi:3-hydroxyacyl-CoA dehydrogenase
MSNAVTFSKHGNIGVITVNNPPVNATSQQVRAGLRECVEQGAADADVAALVVRCEGSTFIAGADIREFGKPPMDPRLWDVVHFIEQSKKPVIAAIQGFALGGGLEVALGCHFRIAVPSAKLGLPEVKLGILPGAGGTQRLPRLIGVKAALDTIVSGTPIPAKKALALGLLDEIVEGDLFEAALQFAEKVVAEKRSIRAVSSLPVHLDTPGLFEEYRTSIAKKQRGFLAPFACIKAVQGAVELPFAEGMKLERSLFVELAASSHAKAQQHVFFAEREVAKIPGLAPDVVAREVKAVGVIGAGTMGGGIAMCFVNAGTPVVLLDTSQENLDRGLSTIRRNYANSVKNGSLAEAEMEKRLQLITPTLSFEDLKNADLVIEAVFEEMGIKRDVFNKLDSVCKAGAILASNTSYLNIDEIAAATKRPQDVMGMHFFSPANVMKLLENVRGEKTSPEVYATAMKVGKSIGKVSVLVGVCDGFVGNRMLSKRAREAYFMLEEGASPQQVDKALYDFGFPMGPFAMSDLAGLDVAWRNRKAKFDRLTAREQTCDILDQLCESGRHGQKTGSGFYRYDEKRNAVPDQTVEEIIINHSKKSGIDRRQISEQEILERCLYSMINEGAKILEEGIVARPLDIDIVWINGYGFPAYRGGPMFYADQIGLKVIYEAILKYQDQVGSQYWKPAPLLEKLAEEGKGFYSR